MLLVVTDANGAQQTVVVNAQETPADFSGSIAVTGTSQQLAAANANRSGWLIQNRGANPMYVNDLGVAASSTVSADNGSFEIAPGASFPPFGYPISTSIFNIVGTAADTFVYREW